MNTTIQRNVPIRPGERQLPAVNVHTTFCSGCGIAAAPADGTECQTCLSIARAAWKVNDPLPIQVHIAIFLALVVLVIGLTLALRIAR